MADVHSTFLGAEQCDTHRNIGLQNVAKFTPFRDLPFNDAADRWLQVKQLSVRDRTFSDYTTKFPKLKEFFGSLPLIQITVDHLREYQRQRIAQVRARRTAEPCRGKATQHGAVTVNHECAILRQILREAGLWDVGFRGRFKPLPLSHVTPGRALSHDELRRLFEAARTKKRWTVAFYASVLSANTAAGPGEIRQLQLQDIDLEHRIIHIRRSVKNAYRFRDIDLNDDAHAAVQALLQRAVSRGASSPEDYLLPAQRHGLLSHSHEPMRSWKTAWRKMLAAAGLPPDTRIYDLRHTAITNLYSNPLIPERAIIEIAGWSGPEMAARYAHVRRGEKVKALSQLATGVLAASSTIDATHPVPALPSQKQQTATAAFPPNSLPPVTDTLSYVYRAAEMAPKSNGGPTPALPARYRNGEDA